MGRIVKGRDVGRALFSGCRGVVELRALPSARSGFYAPEDASGMATFLRDHPEENVYWGVGTRCNASSGALSNVLDLGAVYVDLDDKHAPSADTIQRRATFPFPPSLIIGTGGGDHRYWFLHEPMNLQDPREVTRAYDVLQRLRVYLGADPAVAEPARILRVPSTRNWKYQPPRAVRVSSFAPARRYNVSELLDWLPSVPAMTGPATSIDLSTPVASHRNVTLYTLGRGLKARGLPLGVLATTIRFINTRCCVPPLDEQEIVQIVNHVIQQPNRTPAPLPGRISQTITVKVG